MTQWLLIRRLRGPAFLLLIGVMAMLHEWADFPLFRSWPLLLILAGLLSLAERVALSRADLDAFDPVTGQPRAEGYYPGSASSGSSVVPAMIVPEHKADEGRI